MSSVTPQLFNDDGPQPHLVIATEYVLNALAYLPDGRRIVTGFEDGTVTVWNVEDGKQEGSSMQHENGVNGLVATRDGKKIISCEGEGGIKVWDVESHQLVKEWTHPEEGPSIAVSPDDQLIAVGLRTVFIYAMEEGWRVIQSIEVCEKVWSMSFSPDSGKLACVANHDIVVYDASNGALILGPITGHEHSIWSLLWSHDGNRLFSGSWDRTIGCWNSDTEEPIGHPWTGHTEFISSLSLSPDGSILASASNDHTVRFWDTSSGCSIGQPLRHDGGVHTVSFSPSGEFVASARSDGKIYFWRVSTTVPSYLKLPSTLPNIHRALSPAVDQYAISNFKYVILEACVTDLT